MTENIITNIDIGTVYAENFAEGQQSRQSHWQTKTTPEKPDVMEIHYQSFARLANFFGRDMRAHCHAQDFQLHMLTSGHIELQLDEQRYSLQAPLFILTPPAVPHAFCTEADSDGHVLTVRQHLIWPVLESLWQGSDKACYAPAVCLSLADQPEDVATLGHYWSLIKEEFFRRQPGREYILRALVQAVFTLLLRRLKSSDQAIGCPRGELKLFRRFSQLVDQHFHQHWSIPQYASELKLTESRLTDICRRFANSPPKRFIFNRQLREARRLLLFSDIPINEIAYLLGFKDPAYFSRFFQRNAGCPPSLFRSRPPTAENRLCR